MPSDVLIAKVHRQSFVIQCLETGWNQYAVHNLVQTKTHFKHIYYCYVYVGSFEELGHVLLDRKFQLI